MYNYAFIEKDKLRPFSNKNIDEYYLDIYSSMFHIDEIQVNEHSENKLIHKIIHAVHNLPCANDFTLTRLHRHFTLQLGERLVEKRNEQTGNPIIKPKVLSDNKKYTPTSFKFVDVPNNNCLAIAPLEYKEISDIDEDYRWYNTDRLFVMNEIGKTLKSLGLTNVIGIGIAENPEIGKVWVERTYITDRSHRLTLEKQNTL